ncbi:DUF1292 domain-containing protein [Alkalihalobacterium elongatum]|uniref:DUF1292 domain-containing protein n=1 Tax=Alkalihalobacterium elongatum TaxID=2675466 RepID=UPI001C1FB8C5|nr:DUF1292 domain-containing protein [Alkalihalobacterium elongatum]
MAVEIGEQLLFGDEGSELLYEVLYTCELDGKQYLVAALSTDIENENEDANIISFTYTEDEEGTLFFDEISDEEWKQVEDKFNAYIEKVGQEG